MRLLECHPTKNKKNKKLEAFFDSALVQSKKPMKGQVPVLNAPTAPERDVIALGNSQGTAKRFR